MKKMLLIINPKSGISKKQKVFDDVVKIINDNEWEVKTIYTERRGHATAIAKKAKGFERIVCMGGDGTFNETINGLMLNPHKTDLGYIPSGSTNDFASGLGLPKIFAKSAKFAANQSAFPTDLGMFKGDIDSQKYFSYATPS